MIAEAGIVIRQAIMITGFVFVMMLVIEYINVQTKGLWRTQFLGNSWKQYIVATLLGAIPGCLGAFTAVSLFSQKALLLTLIIFGISILAGYVTYRIPFSDKFLNRFSESNFPLHDKE